MSCGTPWCNASSPPMKNTAVPPNGMSELTLRNHQRARPLNLRLFRQIAGFFLREQLENRSYEIGICFVAAPEMGSLNETHLHHPGSTDVITFGYSDPKSSEPLRGDIFLCVDDA